MEIGTTLLLIGRRLGELDGLLMVRLCGGRSPSEVMAEQKEKVCVEEQQQLSRMPTCHGRTKSSLVKPLTFLAQADVNKLLKQFACRFDGARNGS